MDAEGEEEGERKESVTCPSGGRGWRETFQFTFSPAGQNLVPAPFPFFSPREGPVAHHAGLRRQVLLLHSSRHSLAIDQSPPTSPLAPPGHAAAASLSRDADANDGTRACVDPRKPTLRKGLDSLPVRSACAAILLPPLRQVEGIQPQKTRILLSILLLT